MGRSLYKIEYHVVAVFSSFLRSVVFCGDEGDSENGQVIARRAKPHVEILSFLDVVSSEQDRGIEPSYTISQ